MWLFWRSHVDLGGNWSYLLELREGHQLVTHGLYARIRHPMYAAFLLFGLTQALLINNWIAGPSGLISIAILFGPRMLHEEAMMRDRFGAEYDAYCARTPRLIPRPRFLTKNPKKGV
ncbi:MAG: hypothetical protein CSA74_12935 [Rhodobacterales bacterium]|nr:MAG: hypothetical protein CSA74_12935 [Rhodobacterales bacterium]